MQSIFCVILVISSEFLVLLIPIYWPQFLVENHFLKNFISHELLSVLAVIVTITAASAANIHIALNRAEETIKKRDYFKAARKEINEGIYYLIVLFLVAVITLIIRSSFIDNLCIVSSLTGFSLVILLMNILILIDTTMAAFAITPFLSPSDES